MQRLCRSRSYYFRFEWMETSDYCGCLDVCFERVTGPRLGRHPAADFLTPSAAMAALGGGGIAAGGLAGGQSAEAASAPGGCSLAQPCRGLFS